METITPSITQQESPKLQKALKRMRHPWVMRLYFLKKLPTLTLWGVRIQEITPNRSVIRLPFSWRSQNPFRSIYFAAQSGAAELSSGLLAMLAMEKLGKVSMLVTRVSSDFTKKAGTAAFFECTDGDILQETIQKAIDTGEGQQVTVTSIGRMADGVEVSRTEITWSFKKSRKR